MINLTAHQSILLDGYISALLSKITHYNRQGQGVERRTWILPIHDLNHQIKLSGVLKQNNS